MTGRYPENRSTSREAGRVAPRLAVLGMTVLTLALAQYSRARAAVGVWSQPNMDSWFYPNAEGAGARLFGPSFAGDLSVTEGQFSPLGASSPARLGTVLVGFDTTTIGGTPAVPKDLLPGRYHIRSAKITMTMASGSGSSLLYHDQPITSEEILRQISGESQMSPLRRPMELYGAGFRGGYSGIEFSPNHPALFDESTHPYGAGGYRGFPVIGDAAEPGSYVDVSNSVTGGFSETHANSAPFDPTPWAIGKLNLPPGAVIGTNARFEFTIDLDQPGVRQYLRDGLAGGAVAFFVSSLHQTGQLGTGGGYPQWYLREAGATHAPTLSLDYEVLDEILQGDYDGNGAVETADYQFWKRAYGQHVAPFHGADGNGNGVVDAADYTVWRTHLGESIEGGLGEVFAVVPEPATLCQGFLALVIGVLIGQRRRHGLMRPPVANCTRCSHNGTNRRSTLRRHSVRSPAFGRGFTLVELLIAIAIIGVLTAVLLPAIQAARETGRRITCGNNLRQIGLAVQQYAAANNHLPPPKLGTQFTTLGSTFVLLLPFLEEGHRFANYDMTRPADDPVNLPSTSQPLEVYTCPSMGMPRAMPEPLCGEKLAYGSYVISTRTDYFNFGKLDGAFANPTNGPYQLGFQHITDGTTKTLLIGETNFSLSRWLWSGCEKLEGGSKGGDYAWAQGYWAMSWGHMAASAPKVYNNSREFLPPLSNRAFRSDHRGGVQFVMLDGGVRFLSDGTSPTIRAALVTRAGNEADHSHR